MDPRLNRLSDQYKEKRTNKDTTVRELYRKYIARREKALIDAAAVAVGLNSLLTVDQLDMSQINPHMEEAFHLAFPEKTLSELSDMSAEQLEGLSSAWKGKYFEVLVRDKLNAGEMVGDIQLEPGQFAELAESVTQPGWDLTIMNDNGTISTELSLKATDSLSYVKEALERYPDIQVLTTDEVLQNPNAVSDMILDSGIENGDLEKAIHEPMTSLIDTVSEDLLDMIVPGLPFILIAFGEGRHILTGRRTFGQVMPSMIKRMAKTGTAMGIGVIVGSLLSAGFGIVAGAGVRLAFSKHETADRTVKNLEQKRLVIDPLQSRYLRPE